MSYNLVLKGDFKAPFWQTGMFVYSFKVIALNDRSFGHKRICVFLNQSYCL